MPKVMVVAMVAALLASCHARLDADAVDDEFGPEDAVASGDALEGIAPVAAEDDYEGGMEDMDEDFRPPDAAGDENQEVDLGAVETLNTAPTDEELRKIEQAASQDSSYDESQPPPENLRPRAKKLAQTADSDAMREGAGGVPQSNEDHHHHHHHHADEQVNVALGGSVEGRMPGQ